MWLFSSESGRFCSSNLVQAFQALFLHIQREAANDTPRQGGTLTPDGGDDLHDPGAGPDLFQGRLGVFYPADADDLYLPGGCVIDRGDRAGGQPAKLWIVAAQP